jgi:hypothetical protein
LQRHGALHFHVRRHLFWPESLASYSDHRISVRLKSLERMGAIKNANGWYEITRFGAGLLRRLLSSTDREASRRMENSTEAGDSTPARIGAGRSSGPPSDGPPPAVGGGDDEGEGEGGAGLSQILRHRVLFSVSEEQQSALIDAAFEKYSDVGGRE